MNYEIKDGYKTNPPRQMMQTKDDAQTFQLQVYKYVRELIINNQLESLLDIGCGMPEKLKLFIAPICKKIWGVDHKNVIDEIVKNESYGFGTWIDSDTFGVELCLRIDVILAADIIEHLENPIILLNSIKEVATETTFIVISSPDRETLNNPNGPPNNLNHVREWTKVEFIKFLHLNNFIILQAFWVTETANYKDIIVLCKVRKDV